MIQKQKYPIGIQDFDKLREQNCLYIDKTKMLHKLINEGSVYFLSRPRRFGKSLLVSTLQCIFEGRRELFKGLAIDDLDFEWDSYPVVRIDMNADNFKEGVQAVKDHIQKQLDKNASRLDVEIDKIGTLSGKFDSLICNAVKKYNKNVVVLIDEYDKPLLETLLIDELHDKVRDVLRAFYGVLKSVDGQLRFTFITGISQMSQVSIFSDVNHPDNISQDKFFDTILGISQEELELYFKDDLKLVAKTLGISYEEILYKVKDWYNGYKFGTNAKGVYNPFSTLNFLKKEEFNNYWFATGTPTFLLDIIEENGLEIFKLDGYKGRESSITDFSDPLNNPIPALYQSGYLTIKDYLDSRRRYTLGYPNKEVKYSFIESLSSRFAPKNLRNEMNFYVDNFCDDVEDGNIDGFMERLKALYSKIPYDLFESKENYYQTIFYLVFELMGQFVNVEVRHAIGRCDAIIQTEDFIYVVEMKLNGKINEALKQIEDKGYAEPFANDSRKLYKIGLVFDSEKKTISEWKVV